MFLLVIYAPFINSITEIPKACTARQLITAVYEASLNEEITGYSNPTLVLGYIKPGGKMVIFGDDLSQTQVALEERDKLILFSAH